MVRIKSRWLLINVRFAPMQDQDGNIIDPASSSSQQESFSYSSTPVPVQLQLLRLLRDALQQSFGDVGSGTAAGSLAVRYYSSTTQNAIVRCSRSALPIVWAAATLATRLSDGRRVRLCVTHCGGAIRKTQQAAIRADRRAIEHLCRTRKRLAAQTAKRQTPTAATASTNTPTHVLVLDDQAQRALELSKREISSIEQ